MSIIDTLAGLPLISPFIEFGFMRRALAGCLALSLGATPIGIFLMLRRMSLAGDAISHAILPGAAVGYLFAGLSLSAMTIGGLVAGIAVALDRQEIAGEQDRRSAAQAVAAEAGVPVLAVAGLADLLAFADGNDTLAQYRAPLQAYRARYGCAPTG